MTVPDHVRGCHAGLRGRDCDHGWSAPPEGGSASRCGGRPDCSLPVRNLACIVVVIYKSQPPLRPDGRGRVARAHPWARSPWPPWDRLALGPPRGRGPGAWATRLLPAPRPGSRALTTKSRPLQSTSAGTPLCGLEVSLGYRMSLQREGVAGQLPSSAPSPSRARPQAPRPEGVLHGAVHAGGKPPTPKRSSSNPS